MKVFRTLPYGTCGCMWDQGCQRCGKGKGFRWPYLPIHIESEELMFTGLICLDCEQALNNSDKQRKLFIKQLEERGIQCSAEIF